MQKTAATATFSKAVRPRRNVIINTYDNVFRVYIFITKIDEILFELNSRFSAELMKVLTLAACIHPRKMSKA